MAGVEDMARDFWATRPRRPRRGRKIAGVAAGIANRYRIDPTLVRVGLVVAAIYGGAGIVVYLLGWLFLPEQDDEVSPFEALIGRGRSSTSAVFTLLLCLGFIPTFSWFVNGFVPGYLGLLVVGGVLYLLHRNRGHLVPDPAGPAPGMPTMSVSTMSIPVPPVPPVPPTPPTPPTPPEPPAPPEPPTVAMATGSRAGTTMPLPQDTAGQAAPDQDTRSPGTPGPEERTSPPAWDPLGAAPFAWDLPDPNPPLDEQEPEPPQRRRKSRIGLLTVGVALIAVAGMSMGVGRGVSPQLIVGVALAVLGLGMVAGSFVRGGRGLVTLAVPLSLIGLAMTVVTPRAGLAGVGEIDLTPATTSELAHEYGRSLGSVQLDLTQLDLTQLEARDRVNTRIDLGAGDVTVVLPPDVDVQVSCHTDVGSIDCLGKMQDGINNPELPSFADYGSDGPGGPALDITVDVGMGSVDVNRHG